MIEPQDIFGATWLERCLVGSFGLWLVLVVLSRTSWIGSHVRAWDKACWLPAAGYFFAVNQNLRLEFRTRDQRGEWGAWSGRDLAEPRRPWHWIVNPWATEPMVFTLVLHRLVQAQGQVPGAARPPVEEFNLRLLCHLLMRDRPRAAALAVRVLGRDEGGRVLYAAEQELAAGPKSPHAA